MNRHFIDLVEQSPVIAAVRDEEKLQKALASDVGIVFLLGGDICSLPGITKRVKEAGKTAVVHLDLVAGLAPRPEACRYIRENTDAQGIITTKNSLIPCARELGLATIQRCFVLDGMALESMEKQSQAKAVQRPDLVEILPGVLAPKIIKKIGQILPVPFICGGLIRDREDVMNALSQGALAVSASDPVVWTM